VTDLLIHAGRVFTAAEHDAVLENAWVRVEAGRIVEIGSSEPNGGDGTQKIEAAESTLLPGLIDCHVHFAMSGGPDWLAEVKEPYAISCWRAAKHARATLRMGFTTVRTLGGRPGARSVADCIALGMLDPEILSGAHQAFGHIVADATGE